MASKYFQKALANTSPESKVFVRKNLDITEQIYAILKRQGKTQKDLAKALGKTEPEVSRLLSGQHNFTLKSLAKLETALGEDIFITPMRAKEAIFQNRPVTTNRVQFKSANVQNIRMNSCFIQQVHTKEMTSYSEDTKDISSRPVSYIVQSSAKT